MQNRTLRPRGSATPYCSPLPHRLQPPALPSSSLVRTIPFMSHDHHAVASSSSGSNFQLILSNALDKYKKRTKNDLITHPLAAQLQSCDSPNAILAVLQGIDQSRSNDERWSRWLDPTVNVIYALSSTVAAGLGLVCVRSWTRLRSVISYSLCRYSHLQTSYLPGLAFSFRCVSFLLLLCGPINT